MALSCLAPGETAIGREFRGADCAAECEELPLLVGGDVLV
jgi:hypothetical protein